MNKTAIKNYAIWARNTLIEAVKQRAFRYGITEKDCKTVKFGSSDPTRVWFLKTDSARD